MLSLLILHYNSKIFLLQFWFQPKFLHSNPCPQMSSAGFGCFDLVDHQVPQVAPLALPMVPVDPCVPLVPWDPLVAFLVVPLDRPFQVVVGALDPNCDQTVGVDLCVQIWGLLGQRVEDLCN